MLQKPKDKSGGFTLVEIMIVVAIIALLAAIAVPNFLRSRKRSQATAILEELRLIEGAKDQYAIENNKPGTFALVWADLLPYFKPGTRLYNSTSSTDILQNTITLGVVDTLPLISASTRDNFSDVVSSNAAFWGSYAP